MARRHTRKHASKKHHKAGKKGGRRTHKHRKSSKKGGMWGALVKQAVVPAFLFGAQKSMQNRRR